METDAFFITQKPTITIEYCPKCRWLLRAAYMAQELLTTFEDELHGVLLQPSEIAGRYTVFINQNILFDRKREGRFPEIKELKQLVRDQVDPQKNLGHSEKK
ncbi:SelT/SelW/SelH family protein [Mucilaginibacter sp.]|uniref:SelT/SelW/SelH family protein n=1 Tax=Mucilaginibacter sp. TaxID=1882438 RepID=UPI003AFF81E9